MKSHGGLSQLPGQTGHNLTFKLNVKILWVRVQRFLLIHEVEYIYIILLKVNESKPRESDRDCNQLI